MRGACNMIHAASAGKKHIALKQKADVVGRLHRQAYCANVEEFVFDYAGADNPNLWLAMRMNYEALIK